MGKLAGSVRLAEGIGAVFGADTTIPSEPIEVRSGLERSGLAPGDSFGDKV